MRIHIWLMLYTTAYHTALLTNMNYKKHSYGLDFTQNFIFLPDLFSAGCQPDDIIYIYIYIYTVTSWDFVQNILLKTLNREIWSSAAGLEKIHVKLNT